MICKGIDMAEYLKPVHPIIEPDDDKGGLFLGNVAAAKNLKKLSELKIGAVLTVACGARIKYPQQIKNLYIEADDEPEYDLKQHFDKTNEFIHTNLKQTNVLVHCFAGKSRSATVVIAYIMKFHKKPLNIAIQSVREKRQIVEPNFGFIQQLQEYEVQLNYGNKYR